MPAGPPELLELVHRMYDEHPGVRDLAPGPDDLAVWQWFNTNGYEHHESIRALLPPVPPPELRNVVSVGGLIGYLDSGFTSFAMLREEISRPRRVRHRIRTTFDLALTIRAGLRDLVRRPPRRFHQFRHILDFGCGCGRTLRYLLPHVNGASPGSADSTGGPTGNPTGPVRPETTITGVDVNERAIAWCQDHLAPARFQTNHVVPPLPFAKRSFDLIYSISVFTHLAEENHLQWIAELRRVCCPGGMVILTKHGEHALQRLKESEEIRADIGVSPADVERAEQGLRTHGFTFLTQEELARTVDTRVYGLAFISDDYVRDHWYPYFQVAESLPGRLEDWQDVVVLHRP